MTTRATCWSVTINNPIAADEENINLARQKGWKVDGQKEKGKEGTLHYQLIVKTPQVRFSAVKKQFPRAHIEVARNVAALEQYVHKDETREGQLVTASELYPSLQSMWDMFSQWLDDRYESSSGYLTNRHCAGDEKLWLSDFDKFICHAITQGYVVETMAVNPQIRACVKNYAFEIYLRSRIRRQTDRQTDENKMSRSVITEDAGGCDETNGTENYEGEEIFWDEDESYTDSQASGSECSGTSESDSDCEECDSQGD